MVNGSARGVAWVAGVVRWFQTGYIYHYAFAMIVGVFVLMTWFVWLADARRTGSSDRDGRTKWVC